MADGGGLDLRRRAFRAGASIDSRWVVKIFPQFHRGQWESERRLLALFGERLPLPVPGLFAAGSVTTLPDGL